MTAGAELPVVGRYRQGAGPDRPRVYGKMAHGRRRAASGIGHPAGARLASLVYPSGMTTPAKPVDSKVARAERLAAALRENLKRRKTQARTQAKAREQEKESDESG